MTVHKLDTKFQMELQIANALELVCVVKVIQLVKHGFSFFFFACKPKQN